jgi:glutamine phosphoribosylpyrophosphate amidotransferase
MPVITRSQEKKSTVPPIATLILSMDSTSPLHEYSDSSNILIFPIFGPLSKDSKQSSLTSNVIHQESSTMFSSLSSEFHNVSHSQRNFEISNSFQFENMECSVHSLSLSHNSTVSNFAKMEEDCDKESTMSNSTPDLNDITHLLTSMSAQITSQNSKLSNDFQQVSQTNVFFKQEVHLELDELHALIADIK